MTPSENCLNLVKQFEGCRLEAYQDQRSIWTIGYGHIHGVEHSMTITQDQADQWLMEDIECRAMQVSDEVLVSLTQNQFDALVCFVYNVGLGNFQKSTLLQLLNSGVYGNAAEEFLKWDKTNGQDNPGLLRRRKAERQLFLTA